MRRNLRGIPSLLIALRHKNIHFNNVSQYPLLRFLSISPNLSNLKSPHSSIPRPAIYAPFTTTSIDGHEEPHSDPDHESETDFDEEVNPYQAAADPNFETIMDILRTPGAHEKSQKLDQSGANPTPGLVTNVLSATRNDWETAFTFFLWAGKQPGYSHSRREYHSMISVLGKFRKFDTAWALIDNDMRSSSLVAPHTLLIMMRKYAAAHDVAKAINAFYALRRFKFEIGMDEFQGLLSSLSRYKNVKDAEHLLFCNASVFPLNTKSFNIVLNGWCNVIGSLREGKRIWKEMETRGIKHDIYSYSSIMSCLSKANKLNVVLRLYEKMKALGIKPDRKAYNAVIHALAKGKLVNEARSLMRKMEDEGGVIPDSVTYNSLIKPLCKSRMLGEAKQVFDEMTMRGLVPTVRTYHAFFRALRTGDEVFELLGRMRGAGCHPSHDTYIMLIRKFCRWRQIELVFKVWGEMGENGLDPDRSSYIVLIHGLFLNGRLEEAHKYYVEMKEKGLLPEPKLDAIVRAWVAGKGDADRPVIASKDDQWLVDKVRNKSKKNQKDDDFRRQPEVRSVTREKGFSFWDH
ncbi:pentatricopeptide repeat-containing protein at5g15010 mitochondrial [Phtheirospermum japonicum]|uniref:Pentatricopeptide repeat-containing protein at5g15010 mitochondrial n=1 Tax=Phtheirospermum japonicum TaxID=374723 RepID=A0A830BH46_9LAMI|nr:pentatricopeptide repeat-containing protein at5g15010 mitochondrial [Phtheirospermum japonicum]